MAVSVSRVSRRSCLAGTLATRFAVTSLWMTTETELWWVKVRRDVVERRLRVFGTRVALPFRPQSS